MGPCAHGPHRQVIQAQVLLLAADGLANTRIAAQVGVAVISVRRWRARFAPEGLAGVGRVRPGRGRPPAVPAATVAAIIAATQTTTPEGRAQGSCCTMAKAHGVSPATVQRIWASRGVKPHQVGTSKLSTDPRCEEQLVDVVGLYLNSPGPRRGALY